MIYTINGFYSDTNGSFTISAQSLGLCYVGHTHVMEDVTDLATTLALYAPTNHTHTAIANLSVGEDSLIHEITFTHDSDLTLTVGVDSITFDVNGIEADPIASYFFNSNDNRLGNLYIGVAEDYWVNRKGHTLAPVGLTDQNVFIAGSQGSTRSILQAFMYEDGTTTNITKVMDELGNQVFPPMRCDNLRIESIIDSREGGKTVSDFQYPLPVMNQDEMSVDISVTPFPSNAGWYLDTEGMLTEDENLVPEGTGSEHVYYGSQDISISLPRRELLGHYLCKVHAKSLTGATNNTLMFYYSKISNSALSPVVYWPLNTDINPVVVSKMSDVLSTYPHSASPTFSTTTKIKDGAFGPSVTNPSGDTNPAGIVSSGFTNLNIDNGLSLSYFVYPATGYSAYQQTGFLDEVDTNPYLGNFFALAVVSGYPKIYGPPNMSIITSPTRVVLNKWQHLAMTCSKKLTGITTADGFSASTIAKSHFRRFNFYHNGIQISSNIVATALISYHEFASYTNIAALSSLTEDPYYARLTAAYNPTYRAAVLNHTLTNYDITTTYNGRAFQYVDGSNTITVTISVALQGLLSGKTGDILEVSGTVIYPAETWFIGTVVSGSIVWTASNDPVNGFTQLDLKDGMNKLNTKRFFIGNHSSTAQDVGWYYDEVKLLEDVMTLEDVRGEAAWAGYTFTAGTVDEEEEEDPSPTGVWGIKYHYPVPDLIQKADTPRAPSGRPADTDSVTLTSSLKVFIIDDTTIAVAGDFTNFWQSRMQTEYPILSNAEINWRNGFLADWKMEYYGRFTMYELASIYEPKIITKYGTAGYFQMDESDVTLLGNWKTATGLMYFKDAYDQRRYWKASFASNAHYAYLRLPSAMTEGSTHTITDGDGNTVTFTYNKDKYSSSIKVNQVGYMPDCQAKYAYWGMWLGTYGPYDRTFSDLTFYLVDATTGSTVFTGTMTRRDKVEEHTTSAGTHWWITGEKVYQMDFSSFTTEGTYKIYIPHVGWSHSFEIGNDAIGRQFYIHAKGMFHQRSGIAKVAPYSNWNIKADHQYTWQGNGLPGEDSDYAYLTSASGAVYSLGCPATDFAINTSNPTDEVLRNVYGGWWDAADWDRRPVHVGCVHYMLMAYDMFPDNFTDGQLNIPESGDGIPDILSEAIWGLDVWRRAQHANGLTGMRIETTSHPVNLIPYAANTTAHMFLARPTCESTMRYCIYAAWLATCLRKANTPNALKWADIFLESAERGFNFAINDDNLVSYSINIGESSAKTEYNFNEPAFKTSSLTSRDTWVLPAACALYRASKNSKYLQYCTTTSYSNYKAYTDNKNEISSYLNINLLCLQNELPSLYNTYRTWLFNYTETWLGYQEEAAYRNLNFSPSHVYFKYQAWGAAHSCARGGLFTVAYWLTGEERYRSAAFNANDWTAGCNPMGRSMTTGMGKVFPVRFLMKLREALRDENNIQEPPRGITPYTWNPSNTDCSKYSYGVYADARTDCNFVKTSVNLLPGPYRSSVNNTVGAVATWLQGIQPVWRKFSACEDYIVSQNEFTVSETLAGNIMLTGCLLKPGWMPSDELKNYTPAADETTLEGFVYLP